MSTGSCRATATPDNAADVGFPCHFNGWTSGAPAWLYDAVSGLELMVGSLLYVDDGPPALLHVQLIIDTTVEEIKKFANVS